MAFDPGTLEASLAAAAGDDRELLLQLQASYAQSLVQHLDLLRRARCDANWYIAAARLKSLAASFCDTGLVALANDALDGAPGDPVVLRRIANHVGKIAPPA